MCNLCNSDIEDLYYFICECPNYSLIRNIMNGKLNNCLPTTRKDFVKFDVDLNETKLKHIYHYLTQENEVRETHYMD